MLPFFFFLVLLLPLTASAQSWPIQDTYFPESYTNSTQSYDKFSVVADFTQLPPTTQGLVNNAFASAGFMNKQNGNIKILANAGWVAGRCNTDPNKPISLWLIGPTGSTEYHPSCHSRFSRIQLQVTRFKTTGETTFNWYNQTTGEHCWFNKPNGWCNLSSGCAAITPMYPISRINVVRYSGPTYPYPVVISVYQPVRTGTVPITTGSLGGYTFPSPYLAASSTWQSYRYDRVNP